MNKTRIAIILLCVLLFVSITYIGVTEFNKYKQNLYINGVNDGITYRNLKIVEDLSNDGSTVISIVYNNQTKNIVLVPKNG